MEKIISVAVAFMMVISGFPLGVNGAGVSVSAEAAILVSAYSGETLFEKNADEKRAIASITKIMTAVVALEAAEYEDIEIEFTQDMQAEGSSLYLQTGDVLKLSELVKGMMIVSGNDAANAAAIGIAGSKEKFADMMNAKAKELGMTNTHFVTPSGLDDDEHYSTARDMAVLCCYAMNMQSFAEIVSEKTAVVSYVHPEGKKQTCVNHNKLLSLYEGCIGIKTGYTQKAGRTLTSCSERDGVRLIAVTLNDRDDWNDHQTLYDYGFSALSEVSLSGESNIIELPVVGGESDFADVCATRECRVHILDDSRDKIVQRVYMPHFVYAPVEKDKIVGEARYYLGGREIAYAKLRVKECVDMQTENS